MGKLTISMAIFNSYVKLPECNMGENTWFQLVCLVLFNLKNWDFEVRIESLWTSKWLIWMFIYQDMVSECIKCFVFFLLIPILVLSLKRCNGWKDNHQRLIGVQTCCKKKHQPEVFDDLLGSPRQYMIIFFIVLNHPKKMLWLSWFRMAQASIFSAVPCTVFMCHLCETIMCWTTECSSPGHEKTTKPSKIRLASEYVKKNMIQGMFNNCLSRLWHFW